MSEKHLRLSSGQDALLKLYAGLPVQFLNLCARIDLESPIEEETAIKALQTTAENLTYCRMRIHKEKDGEIKQYYCDDEVQNIEFVDMSQASQKELDKYISSLATTPFPNNAFDCQLFRFSLIRTADGHILCFCMYHVIADAYGLMHTINTFDKVYTALVNHTPLPEISNTTFEDIEESWNYSDERKKKDLEWWTENFTPEPHFTSINGLGNPEFIKGKNFGHSQTILQRKRDVITKVIPKEFVEQVNAASNQSGIAPQVYYLLPFRSYMAHVSGTDDVTIQTTAARRAKKTHRNSGLSRVNMLTYRTIISEDMSVQEALLSMNQSLREMYRHMDCMITQTGAILPKLYGLTSNHTYSTVLFTYQPYFDIENSNLKFSASQITSGVASTPLYLNIMPLDATGCLYAFYQYAINYTKPESLEQYHAFMMRFLPESLAHPEVKLETLIRNCLNQ